MDVYILDELLRRVVVIDNYVSLIWTERFAELGDFQFTVFSTVESRKLLVVQTKMAINESRRVMVIETVEESTDADGEALLTVKGRSLESVLDERIARNSLVDTTTEEKWVLNGTPGSILRTLFDRVCVQGGLSVSDRIPFLVPGSLYPPSNIPESTETLLVELPIQTLYEAMTKLASLYDLGFRLVRDLDKSKLYFDVYSGSDRTTRQTVLPPVIFSPELDNLSNVASLHSISNYKNVAYVFSSLGSTIVYADNASATTAGFDRRALHVTVDDVSEAVGGGGNIPLLTLLTQRGKEALAENRSLSAFDGELSPNSGYKYSVHYDLGDLVEMRNTDGATNYMRVTEQIFVSDREGVRSYPTLTIDVFITPGSWLSWDANQVWSYATGTWADA